MKLVSPSSAAGPRAVVDIGSNSVRMVVYEGNLRAPTPMFNEKVLCALGDDLTTTGRLSDDGRRRALATIKRFVRLAHSMSAAAVHLVGTAALREAEDGPEFVSLVAAETGYQISVLSGGEEGRYSALGVASGRPDASGIVGDLGGGSLELITMTKGQPGKGKTFPLGPLRLGDLPTPEIESQVEQSLGEFEPLTDMRRVKVFYAVGGAWRSLARLYMMHTSYPLRVLHEFRVSASDLAEFCRLISGLGERSIELISNVGAERRATLPYAALLLARILERWPFRVVVFSGNGIREGVLYDNLAVETQTLDPLIEACEVSAFWRRRFEVPGTELLRWVEPVFTKIRKKDKRVYLAAAILSDLNWRVQPDYRAENAFTFALRAPFTAVSHKQRVWLATALYARYSQNFKQSLAPMMALISPEEVEEARSLGLSFRLAHTLSGGLSENLKGFRLYRENEHLVLDADPGSIDLNGDLVEKRFLSLAESFNLNPRFQIREQDNPNSETLAAGS